MSFDPYAGASDDRYEAMAAIRAAGGVTETAVGHYLATYEAVLAGLKAVEMFVGSFLDTSGLPEDLVPISAIPEPRHGRIRRVINSVVAPHRTHEVEPFVRELSDRLVADALAAPAPVDLVDVIVDAFPSTVIAHVLGVPMEDCDLFRRWSDELLANQQSDTPGKTLADNQPEFAAYLEEQIRWRAAADDPPDDVITRFLRTEVDGERLSEAAVITQTMFLIIAGNETTRNLMANVLHTLATEPDLYARLRDDRSLIPVAVEESLRHDSPVQVLARAVLDDTEIAGCPLHQGGRVVFGVASANRDERVFDDADSFRLDRPKPREHLAFGAGPHVCPGATLARMEAVVLLETFCDAVAAFRLAEGFEPELNPVFWALGHRRLQALLTPA